MESVLKQAQDISKSSSDNRTATYATQLDTRFQALLTTIKVTPYI